MMPHHSDDESEYHRPEECNTIRDLGMGKLHNHTPKTVLMHVPTLHKQLNYQAIKVQETV